MDDFGTALDAKSSEQYRELYSLLLETSAALLDPNPGLRMSQPRRRAVLTSPGAAGKTLVGPDVKGKGLAVEG